MTKPLIQNMKRLIVAVFLLAVSSHGADINSTLISADKSLYAGLLKNIRQSGSQSDQVLLQEALLQKLISISDANTSDANVIGKTTYALPKNPDDAKLLFSQWLDLLDRQSELLSKQKSLRDKMAMLGKQIKNDISNDGSLLIYQLQYSLYVKEIRNIEQKKTLIRKNSKQIESLLFQVPKILNLNQQKQLLENQSIKDMLNAQKQKIKMLQIKKERLELLGKTKEINIFTRGFLAEKKRYMQISRNLLASDFLIFCKALQDKDQSAFKWADNIASSCTKQDQRDALQKILGNMEEEYLGTVSTLGGNTLQEAEEAARSVWTMLSSPLFEINNTPISIMKLIEVMLVFAFAFLLGGLFKRSVLRRRKNDADIDNVVYTSSRLLLSNIGYYLILIIAFFSALKVLGVNLTSLAVVAGALSVGIGFGLQNIVSNFVSGLILMFEHSIKIGDYIQLNDKIRGRVTDIRMRSTTIKTNENIDVIVPNQNFIQNNVINWTMDDRLRRFEIPFGVRYGTNPQQVIDVVLKAVKESGFDDIYRSRTRYTRVLMTEMGDSSVNFVLLVWIKGREILYPTRTSSRFLILIYNALNEHNIEIPFPQRDLHIRSIDDNVHIPIDINSNTKENRP